MATDPFESYVGPSGFPAETCDPLAFTDVTFSDCPEAYMAVEGEIAEIFLSNVQFNETTGVYEAVTAPADWLSRPDYLVAGILRIVGFGDKPLSEAVSIPLPKGLTKVIDRRHTLNFDFTDMHADNYDFIRELQGTGLVAINYVDLDGNVYGGANMIIARVNAGNVHARGENALLTGQIIFNWDNMFDPPQGVLEGAAPLTAAKIPAPAALRQNAPKEQTKKVAEPAMV
jgi:hypothetical protein